MGTLLDAYVDEVGQRLPKRMRGDIGAELRSSLQDMLDDRAQTAGRAPDEDTVVNVLREFGPPEKVAASYLPERYLVGPQLYPAFMLVLRILLVVVTVVWLIGLTRSLTEAGPVTMDIVEALIQGVADLAGSALQMLGNLVLIFAVLQWALPDVKVKMPERAWDPRSLKDRRPADRVNVIGTLWELALTIAVIMLFNFYPEVIGLWYRSGGEWRFREFLTPVFFSYLPYLNGLWVATIVQDIVLLRLGTWRPAIRWFSIVRMAATVPLLVQMWSGAPIVYAPPLLHNLVLQVAAVGVGIGVLVEVLRLLGVKNV